VQGDITNIADMNSTFQKIRSKWQRLNILVLNASGGLEKDKEPDYAMRLNMTAQVGLVREALPLMPDGGRIVFVTSHLAHFYGTKPVYDSYEPVAVSKKAGEDALRAMIPEFIRAGIRFVVVSGDLIEGTITPKLLQRQSPGLIESRRRESGTLPNVDEFAAAIVKGAIDDSYAMGDTIYVGSTEWA
jgi:3-oxoacyl-[acyl-carrier protein] reductase